MRCSTFILYLLLIAACLLGLGLLSVLILLWAFDYEDFTTLLLDVVDKADWRDYFKQAVFPPSRFFLARYLLIFLLLAYLPLLWICFRKAKSWSAWIVETGSYFYKAFFAVYKTFSTKELVGFGLVFLLFLLRSLFHIEYYEIDYDEAWTYNHFSSKGFIVSMISPNNNHILYTITSSFLDYLPIPTKYVVRLPALLSVAAMLSIFFAFTHKRFGYSAAIVGLAFLAFSPSVNAYAILGRGYGFMLFFTLLSYIALDGINTKAAERKYYWGLYIGSAILGVYSNPAFFLLWLPLAALFLGKYLYTNFTIAQLKIFIFSHFFIFAPLLFLHLPLVLSNGLSTLGDASTAAVDPEGVMDAGFWYYLHRVADWLLCGHKWLLFPVWIGFALLFLCLSVYKRQERSVSFPLLTIFVLMSVPLFWMLLTRMQIPYRLWCGAVIFLAMGIAIVVSLFVKKGAILFAILLATMMVFASETHYFLNWSATLDREAKKIANILISTTDISECYSFSRYDKPLLTYYFNIYNRPFKCWMPFKESKDYRPFEERIYQAVLLDIDDYNPTAADWAQIKAADYQLIYENYRIKLFLHK